MLAVCVMNYQSTLELWTVWRIALVIGGRGGMSLALRVRTTVGRSRTHAAAASDCTAELQVDHCQLQGRLLGDVRLGLEVFVMQRQFCKRDPAEVRNGDHVAEALTRVAATSTIHQ